MNSGRLSDQVAWISGAGSGIGEATAMYFAEQGAKVAVVDQTLHEATRVADRITAEGGAAVAIHCDVGVEQDVRGSIEQVIAHFGQVNILVNNAGIVHVGQLHECDEADFDRVMAVNVKSMFFSFKHALPYLKKHPRSYIVNVASISSFVGQAGTPAYTASKHAALGLTRSIALDYAADGIRCNAVCPGITDTPMLREHLGKSNGQTEAAIRARLRRVPTGAIVSPRDIAKSIVYLSCEDSSGVTGTSLTVDGGYLAAAEWDSKGHTAFMEPTESRENETRMC